MINHSSVQSNVNVLGEKTRGNRDRGSWGKIVIRAREDRRGWTTLVSVGRRKGRERGARLISRESVSFA